MPSAAQCRCFPAGRLRERVTLQKPVLSQDAAGQPIPTWTTVATGIPAEVLFVAGREGFRNQQQVIAAYTHKVTIRYRSDVSPQMRLLWGSRVLNIESAGDPVGNHLELTILCTEDAG